MSYSKNVSRWDRRGYQMPLVHANTPSTYVVTKNKTPNYRPKYEHKWDAKLNDRRFIYWCMKAVNKYIDHPAMRTQEIEIMYYGEDEKKDHYGQGCIELGDGEMLTLFTFPIIVNYIDANKTLAKAEHPLQAVYNVCATDIPNSLSKEEKTTAMKVFTERELLYRNMLLDEINAK